jgi:DNA-binding transcriptional ArsR family regulator
MTHDVDEPPVERLSLPTVLAALADPGRLAMLRALLDLGEGSCGGVAEAAGLTINKSTRSHHWRVLREAGVVSSRYVGTSKLVSLRRADLDARFPGLLDAVLGRTVGQERAGAAEQVDYSVPVRS